MEAEVPTESKEQQDKAANDMANNSTEAAVKAPVDQLDISEVKTEQKFELKSE